MTGDVIMCDSSRLLNKKSTAYAAAVQVVSLCQNDVGTRKGQMPAGIFVQTADCCLQHAKKGKVVAGGN